MLGIEVFRRNFYWIANDSLGYPVTLVDARRLARNQPQTAPPSLSQSLCIESQIVESAYKDLAETGVGLIRRSCLDLENVIHSY